MRTATVMILILLLLPQAAVHAEDNPSIAILRFGSLRTFDVTEGAILDVLESYGFISAEENAHLHSRQDLQGEKINVLWGSADFDLPTANLVLRTALDAEPDVLVTITTTMTQLALNATADMDDPPVLLFTSVYNPYEAGILQSACVKPDHVGGSLSSTPYEEVISLLMAENPDIEVIGTIFNASEAAGAVGAEEIARIGEQYGLTVLGVAVTDIDEMALAAEGLADKGIDAFVMPIDLRTGAAGLPIVVNLSNEYGIPVFHPILFSIYYGATVSSGFYHYYAQGENVGILLAAHLNGDIDIAQTAINEQTGSAIGINLDMAGRQDIEISQELIDQADAVIVAGEVTISDRVATELRVEGEVMPLAERQAGDQAFLANLHCSPERIAEEQAALDAAEA
ncbi:MAG: hypothetical protein F4Z94_03610 [Chloroflexi bacterium]|nr:hypothetical protein [Chloroflexota bacterium]MYC54442.1 hypothetical protein [Chloroflexota bacterium]